MHDAIARRIGEWVDLTTNEAYVRWGSDSDGYKTLTFSLEQGKDGRYWPLLTRQDKLIGEVRADYRRRDYPEVIMRAYRYNEIGEHIRTVHHPELDGPFSLRVRNDGIVTD